MYVIPYILIYFQIKYKLRYNQNNIEIKDP